MGRIAEDDPGLGAYLTQVERYPVLEREDELRLARAYRASEDPAIAHELVRANLRYVVRIALRYRGYGLAMGDLIEEGNVGLLMAVRRFEPERELRFMTYGSYWVRAYILAYILKQRTQVAVGTGPLQSRLFFGLARERARLTAALGEHASADEIDEHLATHFRTTKERIHEIGDRLDAKDSSLDAPMFRDGAASAVEHLADPTADMEGDAELHERDVEIRRRVQDVCAQLAPRERYIVDQRLLTDEEATLAEIGETLHLSRERVRQLEARIKIKLRRAVADLVPNAA